MVKKLAAIIILSFFWSCQSSNIEEQFSETNELPQQEGWGIEITLSEKGKVRAIIKSEHLEKFENIKQVKLDGNVVADFYDNMEKHTTLVYSDFASIDEQSKIMMAHGNVVVVSDSGITLVTDTLNLDQESKLIFTDDSVRITTTGTDTLYGIGFESNIDLDEWKILKPWGVTEISDDK